jgi:hypothetical protein
VLQQLRERQVAEERVTTYEKQRIAAEGEKALREAEARANQQTAITQSELSIIVRENEGKAALRQATQQAEQTRTWPRRKASARILGEGEAARMVALAAADAERITKTGLATAETIARQAEARAGRTTSLPARSWSAWPKRWRSRAWISCPASRSAPAATTRPAARSPLIGMMLGEKGKDAGSRRTERTGPDALIRNWRPRSRETERAVPFCSAVDHVRHEAAPVTGNPLVLAQADVRGCARRASFRNPTPACCASS